MSKPEPKKGPQQSASNKKWFLRSTAKAMAGKVKIGEILCKEGYITKAQLDAAVAQQKKNDGRLGNILLKLGYIEEETILNVLTRAYNYNPAKLSEITPDPRALRLLPFEKAKVHLAFPLKISDDFLEVAMAEPTDTTVVETLQEQLKTRIKVFVCTEKDIIEAYKNHYKISDEEYKSFFETNEKEDELGPPITQVEDFGSLVSEAAQQFVVEMDPEPTAQDEFSAGDAPIIKLVNGIMMKAINDGVSDIHIEPFEKALQVRYRVDGSLYKSMNLPLGIKDALVSRVKVLAGLDISERRVPQDGRMKLRLGKNRAVDFRMSTLPTLFGEGIVMRILDPSALNMDITKLGLEPDTFEALKRCIHRPYGLILVTGPTGSGKTTTLYSILSVLNKEDVKILTAEDPVEFNFKGINQVLVRNEVGMTFASALKAFLRQDPDIIMVGEVRDLETAEMALRAAMTGHLVLSTLHTNDSSSTIARLLDIGIPSYLLATSVTMVLSQRLVRRLCPKCRVKLDNLDPLELEKIGFPKEEIPNLNIYGPMGCEECNSGYKGRVGLYELMEITDEVEKAIHTALPEDQLRKIAQNEGMRTLREEGLQKIRQGVTTIQEVLKNTATRKEALPAYLVNPDVERYEDGDYIIREGNEDVDFFKLVQGAVVVAKKGKKIAEITQPNTYFGEMASILGEVRSASIISKGRSMVKRFPGGKLSEVIEKHPEVARHLFEIIVKRLDQANKLTLKVFDGLKQKAHKKLP